MPPRLAKLRGAELAAGLVPAYEVGGDWYDHAQNPEGAWIAIADSAGKGAPAAGASTIALGALRAARRAGLDLAGSARHIDAAVRELGAPDTFVTAVLGHWQPELRRLTWLRFGHPLPLLVDANGRCTQLGPSAGHPPLGLLPPVVRLDPHAITLRPSDRLLLISDGVTERRTANGGLFGRDGIQAAIDGAIDGSAAALATALVTAVMTASPRAPTDDATVLVLASEH